jgi:hypothetical protein
MRTWSVYLALIISAAALRADAAQYPNDGSPLGSNLSWVCDWNTQIPWVDMFMFFRGWERGDGSAFPAAQLDSCGWVKYLNAGEVANVGHGSGSAGHYPGGNYTLLWQGEGTLATRGSSAGAAQFVSYDSVNHRAVVHVDSTQDWFGISITKTTPGNYVRNIHMIMPGFENTWQSDIWHPAFIETHKRFRVLRYMHWGAIDGGNTQTNWSDIKPGCWWNQGQTDYFSDSRGLTNPAGGAVSPAWMIRLCKRLHADGWFCMPHRATDDCIRQYATLLRDSMPADVRIYVEYSNECWNTAAAWYPEYAYCCSLSTANHLSNGYAEGYALRSSQMWRIFDSVFGSQKGRVVKVLAGQFGNSGLFDYMFSVLDNATLNPDNEQPTVLSTAPYLDPTGYKLGISADSFYTLVMTRALPGNRISMAADIAKARSRGITLVAYEGGTSFSSDVAAVNTFFNTFNKDARMKNIYQQYFDNWFGQGGNMFVHFEDVRLPGTAVGPFSSMDYYDQPRSQAPKYDALMTFIEDSIGVWTTRALPRSGVAAPARGQTKTAPFTGVFSVNGRLIEAVRSGNSVSGLAPWANRCASAIYVLEEGRGVRLLTK